MCTAIFNVSRVTLITGHLLKTDHGKCSKTLEPQHKIFKNVCAASKASDQPAHTHSLIRAFTSRLNIL